MSPLPLRVRTMGAWASATALLLVLAGCGGDGGGEGDAASGMRLQASDGMGSLATLAIAAGTIQTDEDAGVSDPVDTLSTGEIRFRRIDFDGGHRYLGCCEITRGQWTALAVAAGFSDADHLRPWATVAPADADGPRDLPDLPANALTASLVQEVIDAYDALYDVRLALPTDAEWLAGCYGGDGTTYSWGEDESQEVVRSSAVVAQTRHMDGPDVVGGAGPTRRIPNRLGFYDMHGNVWELIAPGGDGVGRLRGGSWKDNLRSTRRSATQAMEIEAPHALAGARLVLRDD